MMIANPMKICGRIHTIKILTNDIKVKLSNKVTPLILIQSWLFAESKVMVKTVLMSAHNRLGQYRRQGHGYHNKSNRCDDNDKNVMDTSTTSL